MHNEQPLTGLQLRSLVKKDGELELSLITVPVPDPGPEEVAVRIEGAPINPSDLALLFGAADMRTMRQTGTPASPVLTASIPEKAMKAMAGRLGESMPVGNEGAGVVVRTGSSEVARALLGKTVAILGGAMYAQYRTVKVAQCLILPAGTTPRDGASSFVNPLTSLCMVETMRLEGHKALVHTAAASNLGQMLNRVCIEDRIQLVNIVRKQEQEDILRALGATYVCNSTAPAFMDDLTRALLATGATIAFDAVGGGKLASQILTCMEAAANSTAKEYSRYGSSTYKQVYIYGVLDRGPTELVRNYGMAWGVGGWLLMPFLQKIGFSAGQKLRERVAANLKTTFASHYTKEVSLIEALQPDAIAVYGRIGTGEKYLLNPNKE
ncbi:MAG TPA: zinc-binding dehydrogenase [Steroidobacteraceae bacterium]|jgi:NADPH2:quinone reductase